MLRIYTILDNDYMIIVINNNNKVMVMGNLGVSIPGHVNEEADGSVALLAAHVALEHIVAAVVAHVNGVEHGVLEEDITVLALVDGTRRRRSSGWRSCNR